MTTTTETHSVEDVTVLDRRIQYLKAGDGPTVVVLHHSTGNPGWTRIHELLAEQHTVIAMDMPGFGQSERPEWARHASDIASNVNYALRRLELTDVCLVGSGFGGWVAAEMAMQNDSRIRGLTLVGAAGIRPTDGEIADQMLMDYPEYVRAGFHDESKYVDLFGEEPDEATRELWDFSREMTARLTWKPYMFDRALIHLLPEVQTSTLVVWGDDDQIVPRNIGEQYVAALPNARLEIVENCGHAVDLEQPERLAELITAHVAAH